MYQGHRCVCQRLRQALGTFSMLKWCCRDLDCSYFCHSDELCKCLQSRGFGGKSCLSMWEYPEVPSGHISRQYTFQIYYRASHTGDALRVQGILRIEQRQGDWEPTLVEQARPLLLFLFFFSSFSLFFLLSQALLLVLVLSGVFNFVFRVIICCYSFSCYCCCCLRCCLCCCR